MHFQSLSSNIIYCSLFLSCGLFYIMYGFQLNFPYCNDVPGLMYDNTNHSQHSENSEPWLHLWALLTYCTTHYHVTKDQTTTAINKSATMFFTSRAHKHDEELRLTAQCWRRRRKGPLGLFICQHLMNCLMDNYRNCNNCGIKNFNLDAIEVSVVLNVSYVLPYSCRVTLTLRNRLIEVYHYSQIWRSNRSNSDLYPIEKVWFW